MIRIAPKYLLPRGYTAIALFPFILLREKSLLGNKVLLNHERIHLRQQAELLVLPFYIWYAAEYLVRFALYKDHSKAYRNISFEREAYRHEANSNYLQERKIWTFINFLSVDN